MGNTSTLRICGSDYCLIVFLEVRYVHVCLVRSNSLGPHGLGPSIYGQTCWFPLSMGFSRQECWSGLPFPPPKYLPTPGIEPVSPTLQWTAETSWKLLSFIGVGSLSLLQGNFLTQESNQCLLHCRRILY